MGLFLQNSSIKHVAHHFTFLKHNSSAFEDHQILKILTNQWKPFVRLSILQGVLAKCKQKKVTLFITVVICMVLNVACILAQWHEASLLCKGKKSTAGIVPCVVVCSWWCVALPSVCHSFHCSSCWKWDHFEHIAGMVQGMVDLHWHCGYFWNTINKARKGRKVLSGSSRELPSDVGVDWRHIPALYYCNLINYYQPGSLKDVQCRLLFMYQDEKYDVDWLCYT